MTIHLPTIPKGIERDQTEHGRLYYSRKQLQEYGHACALAMVLKEAKTQKTRDINLDDLRRMFGMTV